jgi:hypothetical protein
MIAMISIVLVTPALLALKFCSFRRKATLIILKPGMSKTPANKLPTIEPSTSRPLPSVKANAYSKISTIEPKVALMTAPIPIDDCAEMDATAIPMKYESGMTLSRESKKIRSREARRERMTGTC